jgi:hypothetical protein
MRRRLQFALPWLTVAVIAAPLAQGVDPKRMEAFAASLYERMDLDGDGRLTQEEYEHTRGGGFKVDYALLDLDRDGTVTKKEYLLAVRQYHQPHGARSI